VRGGAGKKRERVAGERNQRRGEGTIWLGTVTNLKKVPRVHNAQNGPKDLIIGRNKPGKKKKGGIQGTCSEKKPLKTQLERTKGGRKNRVKRVQNPTRPEPRDKARRGRRELFAENIVDEKKKNERISNHTRTRVPRNKKDKNKRGPKMDGIGYAQNLETRGAVYNTTPHQRGGSQICQLGRQADDQKSKASGEGNS